MAEWIAGGEPSMDLWQMDVRRFGAQYRSPSYTLKRVLETYETYYDIHYPFEERQAGRPLRVSPAYDWHRGHGAAFGEKSGWERVNWYEPNAERGDESLRPRGWAGKHWSPAIGAEHVACREAAAIFDESSFAKLEVTGPGAADLLERLCDNRVAREVGRVTYTQMLNSRGGIECDFTVARFGEERFWIVTGTAFGNHDREWIRRHLPEDGSARRARRDARLGLLRDLGTTVPRPARPAHHAVARRTSDFPYMTVREITVGDVPVRALRVTYVGELGWELYCPDRVRRRPVARLSGRRASRTVWWRGDTARSTRCASRRAIASGARTSRPTTRPTRPASDFAVKPGARSSSGATHCR